MINFLRVDQQPKHITLDLFEPTNINGQTLAKKLIELLDSYMLGEKLIGYVRDEGFNLNNMTTTLKSIVSCDMLGLEESFQGTCFRHAFLKVCQYATSKEFFLKDLQYDTYSSIKLSKVAKSISSFNFRLMDMAEFNASLNNQ